jgi:hypothetical protein
VCACVWLNGSYSTENILKRVVLCENGILKSTLEITNIKKRTRFEKIPYSVSKGDFMRHETFPS